MERGPHRPTTILLLVTIWMLSLAQPARAQRAPGARFTAEAFTLAFEASPDGTQSNAAIGALSAAEEEAEAAILARLDRTVSLHCEDRPLSDAMDDLAVAAGVKIRLDYVALEDASIGPDTPVNCELSALTLRSALRYCLGKMDLTFVVKNEMILITTPEKAGNELITRVYPVRDLVLWRRGDETLENYQQLIDVVTATIAPTTWDEVGGPGAIHEFRHSAAIVISQTREVHEQVASLLTAVRRARDVQRISVPGAPARRRVRGSAQEPAADEMVSAPRYVAGATAGWMQPRVHD